MSVVSSSKISRVLAGLPWLILLLGVVMAWVYQHDFQERVLQQRRLEFDLMFDRMLKSIENRVKANEQVLRGVAGLFESSLNVSRTEFQTYVTNLELDELYPGIQGVGFSKLITAQNLQQHISAVRSEGFPDYKVYPEGKRDIYTSIIYLEPFDWRNQRAFGFDMYSEPVRQKAMARARDTGRAALTGKVILLQETEADKQAGVLLYVPVFQRDVEKRQEPFIGWAYSPLRMNDLMSNFLISDHADFNDRIGISIYDGPSQTPASLLYESEAADFRDADALFVARPIEIAGQIWTVAAYTLPGFSKLEQTRGYEISIAIVLISTLVSLLAGILVRDRRRAIAAASVFSRFKAIVDSTSDAIISKDLNGKILSWNRAAETVFGYTTKEIIGKSIQILIPPEMQHEELDILARIENGEKIDHFDTVRRHKDGHLIDMSVSISPIRDARGVVAGASIIARDISQQKQAEIRLHESEERLALATTHNGIGIWDWNLKTMDLIWDDSMFSLYPISRQDFSGSADAWEKSLHSDDVSRVNEELQVALKGTKALDTVFRIIWPGGEIRYIKAMAKLFCDEFGAPIRMLGTNIDITEQKIAEEKLQLAAKVFKYAREGISITDKDATIVEVNDTFTQITGYSREEAIGRNHRFLHSNRHESSFYDTMWKALIEQGHWYGEIWNRRKGGEVYAALITISAVRDANGKTQNYVALFTDITPMKLQQEQLEHCAHYDGLTGLPNRVLLADRLQQAINQSERRNLSLAVVYVDLDGFKTVNDNYDHQVGDELLIEVSRRMKNALRDGDTLARIGGDEFVIVLADLEEIADCKPVLDRLLLAASTPVILNAGVLQVSASLGVTIYPQDDADPDQLMRHADHAMYIAKQGGKNRYHLIDIKSDLDLNGAPERLA